jgi:hypothetical protein
LRGLPFGAAYLYVRFQSYALPIPEVARQIAVLPNSHEITVPINPHDAI